MFVIYRLAIVLSVSALVVDSTGSTSAASLVTSTIQPFDTNLGTLTQVIVTLDPAPVQTSDHSTGFGDIDNHSHTAFTPPVTIAGLGTFTFNPTQTSVEDSNPFSDHNHSLDVGPSTEVFAGAGLGWFLNPSNPTITSVNVPIFQVAPAENHQHTVLLSPIAPRTTYIFDPIPEPATLSLSLLALTGIALAARRRL
ncbi:MAG: PEP-CTERM sorting domain-containing protein [Planctomycetota bacterium]